MPDVEQSPRETAPSPGWTAGPLRSADYRSVRHFTATHQVDLVDADHATGRCYFAVIVDSGLDHWGRYIDRYVRVEGEWKFEHRRVALDGRVDASWFAS